MQRRTGWIALLVLVGLAMLGCRLRYAERATLTVADGTGPAPTHMLLAAVANCLSASLLFSLRKFKQDPGQLTATATCDIGRNAENRLRVLGIRVEMTLAKPADSMEHLDRILTQFEAFCTVSQSVQAGVPVSIGVTDGLGQRLR